jgi:hypothetical protein
VFGRSIRRRPTDACSARAFDPIGRPLPPRFALAIDLGAGNDYDMPFRFSPLGARRRLKAGLVRGPALMLFALVGTTTLLTAPVTPSMAQETDESAGVEILHTPPKGTELPNPGELFPLKITLLNTKETDLKVRAFIILDGRLTEVPLLSNNLDVSDRPEYGAEIHAPLARLSYQVVVYRKDGQPKLSEHFTVQRPCIPHLTFPSAESLAGLDPTGKPIQPDVRQRLISYVERCTILEREREQYDIAFKLLDQIKTGLAELKEAQGTAGKAETADE